MKMATYKAPKGYKKITQSMRNGLSLLLNGKADFYDLTRAGCNGGSSSHLVKHGLAVKHTDAHGCNLWEIQRTGKSRLRLATIGRLTEIDAAAMLKSMEAHFKLRRPCANCPFLKVGAIELAPARLDGIINGLLEDDRSTFQCHKTVHNNRTGGEWDDEGNYKPSGRESMCAGAMIYLEKIGRPTVGMRLGRVCGVYDPARLKPSFDDVIEPLNHEQKD